MNENFEPNFTDEQTSAPQPAPAPAFEEKPKENFGAGLVGAFLFALAGGILWFVLYQVGFLAGISGFVGVICAIKGYSLFAKGESVKGVIASAIIALIVIIIAWYSCLAYDVYLAYEEWYANGEIDFTITLSEAFRGAYLFLEDPDIASSYLLDLGLGVLLCIVGSFSTIKNAIASAKAKQ